MEKSLGLQFVAEKGTTEKTFAPTDIVDYTYAVLHSPTYREKYKEFLKIDFANVPQTAWEFYIGGYQPAQKWLKDRKGRALAFEDILHYQKSSWH